ncbi:MAG: hypothetical protein ACOYB8_06340 [Eubacteriaceae bacterium]|jgi:uncharacterized membrane protein (DUF485 family)
MSEYKSNEAEMASLIYKYIKDLAEIKYKEEQKSEQSLLKQSSQLQLVFSFLVVLVFSVLPVYIEFHSNLSLSLVWGCVILIIGFLIISFLLALLAQWRFKKTNLADIPELKKFILDNPEWKQMLDPAHQCDQIINYMGKVQVELGQINKKRSNYIMASTICLFVAVALIMVFGIYGCF